MIDRAQVYKLFGVSQLEAELLDSIEFENGYTQAVADAKADLAAYKADLPFRAASIAARPTEDLQLEGLHAEWVQENHS